MLILVDSQDNSIVGASAPAITDEFHSLTGIGWYGSACTLIQEDHNGCSPISLELSADESYRPTHNMFDPVLLRETLRAAPREWIFVAAVAILEIGSVVSAPAPNSPTFIVGRVIAGCGASGIVTGAFM